jgi:hypothetical protein
MLGSRYDRPEAVLGVRTARQRCALVAIDAETLTRASRATLSARRGDDSARPRATCLDAVDGRSSMETLLRPSPRQMSTKPVVLDTAVLNAEGPARPGRTPTQAGSTHAAWDNIAASTS